MFSNKLHWETDPQHHCVFFAFLAQSCPLEEGGRGDTIMHATAATAPENAIKCNYLIWKVLAQQLKLLFVATFVFNLSSMLLLLVAI